jgi:hypothetical protein
MDGGVTVRRGAESVRWSAGGLRNVMQLGREGRGACVEVNQENGWTCLGVEWGEWVFE